MRSRSHSFLAYSADEIADNLRTLQDFTPTLGILFCSPALGIFGCMEAAVSAGCPVLGCSTAGEIIPLAGDVPAHEGSAVGCFLDIDPSLFAVSLFNREGQSFEDLGKRIAAWGLSHFSRPAFIIVVAGLKNNSETIIRTIIGACPEHTAIFGGVAADDGKFEETSVFCQTGVSTDGVAVLLFDAARVDVGGIATSGWTGVGVPMVITASEGNVVHTINDKPALQVYREYLNVSDEAVQRIGVTFPLLVKRPDGSEVLRTFLAIDPVAGTLTYAGMVPQGARVRFSSSFGYEIIEQSVANLREFHSREPGADLVLIFSCMARHEVAGPLVHDEIAAAAALWKAPLIGFFSYGEIGHNRYGTCDFYNETLSLVTIRLKSPHETV